MINIEYIIIIFGILFIIIIGIIIFTRILINYIPILFANISILNIIINHYFYYYFPIIEYYLF